MSIQIVDPRCINLFCQSPCLVSSRSYVILYAHTYEIQLTFDFTFPVSFCIHILLGKPLCRGKCTYIHASFRGTSNSFVFLGTSGSYDSLGREKSRLLWRANEIVWSPGGSQIIIRLSFIAMRKSNYHSLYYSSLVHSLIHFSHPSFSSRQDCEYLYSLALYLLMEIETEETFYGKRKG